MKITALQYLAIVMTCACGDDAMPADPMSHAGSTTDQAGASAPDDAPCTLTIQLLDYKLAPKDVEAASGEIVLCALNNGQAPHDIAVRDASRATLAKTKTLGPGEQDRFSIHLDAALYDLYCTQAGHESLGMKGTLTVK